MNVKIKRLHPDAVIPQYKHDGDAGFDLVAVDDVIIAPGETKLVPTGLALEIPQGYELQIRPRSGITLRTKLRVQLGTVDSNYRGEIGVIVDNFEQKQYMTASDGANWYLDPVYDKKTIDINESESVTTKQHPVGTYIIRKGDRIAQGVIAPVTTATFVEADELGETSRGDGGFGSTDNKGG